MSKKIEEDFGQYYNKENDTWDIMPIIKRAKEEIAKAIKKDIEEKLVRVEHNVPVPFLGISVEDWQEIKKKWGVKE